VFADLYITDSPWPGRICTALLILWGILCLRGSGNPGWHYSVGWPIRFWWWSDAIVVMNGETHGAGFSVPALLADLVVGVGVPTMLFFVVSLRRKQRSEPE
jgi:hypothetical protein